jgi:hypothetical protein
MFPLQPWLWPAETPLRLTRNVTLAAAPDGPPGDGYPVLNLEFLEGRAVIGRNVTLRIEHVALGRARKTSGQGIPFFTGGCDWFVIEN